jgi:hypothetical protein
MPGRIYTKFLSSRKKKSSAHPWQGKFTSLEEIRAYLDNEKLTCLICGKEYSMLTSHLKRGHQIHPDEYKERYGITYTSRLAGTAFKAIARKLFLQKVRQGKLSTTPPEALVKKIMGMKKRPTNEAVRNTARAKVLERHGLDRKYDRRDFEEYLNRIASGRTIAEVSRDKDMPNAGMFYTYMKENNAFRKKFEKIWDALPFAVQARGQKLGTRFDKEIVWLRRKGLDWSDIGRVLDCNSGTAHQRWVKLGQQGKLRKSEFQSQKIWTKKDYSEFLRRVRSGRTPKEVANDDDMPSTPCFYKYMAIDPAYRARFEKIMEQLPFVVQVRAERLGERYRRTIVRLRLKKLTWPQIGEATGINAGTAQTTWSKLKHTGQLKKYIRKI